MKGLSKSFLLLLMAGSSLQLFGQEVQHVGSELEEVKKRMSNLRRMMERDPESVKDSLKRANQAKKSKEAKGRIADYLGENLAEEKVLDLSNGGYREVPDFVFEALSLETLILNDNQISRLPKELSELPNLREIQWMRNGLGKTRVRIAKMPQVNRLFIDDNQLKSVKRFSRMKDLTGISLEENDIEKIPVKHLRKFKKLEKLDLSRNPVTVGFGKYEKLHLKELSLSFCNLRSIDSSIYAMPKLEELILAGNTLERLPDGISQLNSLKHLSLYKNQLSSLPTDIGEMENLEEIDLYYNDLEKVPEEIGKLSSLRVLYLSFNRIYDLPESLGNLMKLERLYIHHNRLSYIPNSIGSLPKLRLLHLQENYLPEFPLQVLDLRNLRDLDISGTEITTLPNSLASLQLTNFYYRGLNLDSRYKEQQRHQEILLEMTSNGVNCFPDISID